MWHVMPIQLIGDATDAATHYRRSGFAKQKGPWHYSYLLSIIAARVKSAEAPLRRRGSLAKPAPGADCEIESLREDLFISSKPFLLPHKGNKSSPGAVVVLQIYG